MSLEGAVELDIINEAMKTHDESVTDTFSPTQFRQPSLVEKALQPEKYRNKRSHHQQGDNEASTPSVANGGIDSSTDDLGPNDSK